MAYPEGVDVSAYNATPNLNGLAFVFVRACYGTAKDTKYDQHAKAVRDAGLVLGAYCFGRNMNAKDQADRLLEIGRDADLLCLDWEADEGHAKMTRAQARTFISRIQPHASTVLYSSLSGYPADAFGADLRWVAYWASAPPKIPWNFWQYNGTGLDRDRFKGTIDELHALVGWPTGGEAEPMTNLVPLTAHRVVDLKAGTVLEKNPGGDPYTTLQSDISLGLLGATATHYHVADGDYGVYVPRDLATVRIADINIGK